MVSIIILSYNTKELLQRCLESLYKNLKKIEFEVIVVDNASLDDSAKMVKDNFKDAIVIENKKNFGFSKGNNIGAKIAKGEYLVFLNSDTELLDDRITGMINFLKSHETVGILGGRLKNQDESLQKSAGIFYTLPNVFLMLFGGEKIGMLRLSPSSTKKVDWVSGAFMMIRKEIFDKLKGFDENFFMYVEDMEICFRAKRLGFTTYFYSNIEVLHSQLGSSNRAFAIAQIYRGLLYFYKKHKSYIEYFLVKSLLIAKGVTAIIIGVITFNKKLTATYKKAIAFNI